MKCLFSFVQLTLFTVVSSTPRNNEFVREKRQALPSYNKWTNNTLNYYYDNLPLEMEAMFRDAIRYLKSHTCTKFKNTRDAQFTVRISNKKDICSSYFGMQKRNQNMYLGYSCAAFGSAVHELMHALGFAHGQARSDRDKYLFVNSSNHNNEKENTFDQYPFDYGSVMLYERTSQLIPKDLEYRYTMGSLRVAFYDMVFLNNYYGCNCDQHSKLKCQNGGYQNPSNCNECLCTDGFRGTLCDEYDGYVLRASSEWKTDRYYLTRRSGTFQDTKPLINNFLAPEGSTIEVRVVRLDGFFCQSTCDYNGVELKHKTDRRIVSPLVCCNDDDLWNVTRSSTNNPFVILKYGSDKGPDLEFEYRYIENANTTTESKTNNFELTSNID